ncbi:MAG: hypothetical protein ABUL64_02500, partial [Singulisphaera sp.]
SVRMLAPVYVALAIAAGACGPALVSLAARRPAFFRGWVVAPITLAALYAMVGGWSHPFLPFALRTAVFSKINYPDDVLAWRVPAAHWVVQRTREEVGLPPAGQEVTKNPALGLLTDDSYMAVALQRAHGRPVMIWSPEADFVFDPQLTGAAVRDRLREQAIPFVTPYDGNLPFLRRYPFYGEDSTHWQQVQLEGQQLPLYLLPP